MQQVHAEDLDLAEHEDIGRYVGMHGTSAMSIADTAEEAESDALEVVQAAGGDVSAVWVAQITE